jgi:hypothetical protein
LILKDPIGPCPSESALAKVFGEITPPKYFRTSERPMTGGYPSIIDKKLNFSISYPVFEVFAHLFSRMARYAGRGKIEGRAFMLSKIRKIE